MGDNGKILAEKEFVLIQEIARKPDHTQRSLSQSAGMSLGTTNLLIRRLARKGLIKVTHLDWKRTQYLLTPEGMMEKTQKAYHYTLYTLRLFRQIRENMATALRGEYEEGRRRFVLVAQDELLELLRDTIQALGFGDASFAFFKTFAEVPPDAELVLTATLEPTQPAEGQRIVSLVDFHNTDFRLS